MSLVIDIIIVFLLALGGLLGWKAGVLKTLVKFVGLVAITIIAFSLKNVLSTFLMQTFPFFNYPGFTDLLSINIFVYNAISFILIFVLLYCLLNIVLSITGFLNTLLKFTVIWILPSKILGAVFGVLEMYLFIFVALFVLAQIPFTSNIALAGNIPTVMMKHTPIVGPFVTRTASSMAHINEIMKEDNKDKTTQDLDLQILTRALGAGIISKDLLQELIEDEKLDFKNVSFG